jgi:hypothetical protein
MFGENNAYYNETLKKNIAAFGTLFNQVTLVRKDNNGDVYTKIKVPILYGPKEKFIYRLITETGVTDNTHIQATFPKMGFEILNILYDPTRKFNKILQKKVITESYTDIGFVAVPYNISINLYAFTRNLEDNLQIIEQIVPYFTPDFTVSLNYNSLNQGIDVPIVLNDVNTSEDYEGDFSTRRSVTTVFNFTMKTYLYGHIKRNTSMIIENSRVSIYNGLTASAQNLVYNVGYTGDAVTGSITYSEFEL